MLRPLLSHWEWRVFPQVKTVSPASKSRFKEQTSNVQSLCETGDGKENMRKKGHRCLVLSSATQIPSSPGSPDRWTQHIPPPRLTETPNRESILERKDQDVGKFLHHGQVYIMAQHVQLPKLIQANTLTTMPLIPSWLQQLKMAHFKKHSPLYSLKVGRISKLKNDLESEEI